MSRNYHPWVVGIAAAVVVAAIALAFRWSGSETPESAPLAVACYANLPDGYDARAIRAERLAWRCDSSTPPITERPLAIRLAVSLPQEYERLWLESRIAEFESLSVTTIFRSGKIDTRQYVPRALEASESNFTYSIPIDPARGEVDRVFAVFKGLEFPPAAMETRLVSKPSVETKAGRNMIAVASLVAGFMLLPVISNFIYFRGLQERFLLWHSAFALSLSLHIAGSGPLMTIVPLDVREAYVVHETSFALAILAAVMFLRSILEPGVVPRSLRRALGFCGILLIMLLIYRLGFPEVFRPQATAIYFLGYLPVLVTIVLALGVAAWRGSRAAKIQLLAWAPIALLGSARLVAMIFDQGAYIDGSQFLWGAAAFDVLVTALGVIDRVMLMRYERDAAVRTAEEMSRIASRDALTGLLNRRALDQNFETLRNSGFSVFCVLDIDWFKSINDEFGHQTGDQVLVSVARALAEDGSTLAFRVGGEEFVLLIQGADARETAERQRERIASQVAADLPKLGREVTASMGLVEVSDNPALVVALSDIYEFADQLLYQAKASGRNRIKAGRITYFATRGMDRRQGERRQQGRRQSA